MYFKITVHTICIAAMTWEFKLRNGNLPMFCLAAKRTLPTTYLTKCPHIKSTEKSLCISEVHRFSLH